MADWIRMPFGEVSGVGRGMGVLDGGGDREGKEAVFGVNFWRPIVTNGPLLRSLVMQKCVQRSSCRLGW